MRKKVIFKVRLFSCFVVDLILRSFLSTRIEIVILTTKKYFLHRALLSLLSHKTVCSLQQMSQWTPYSLEKTKKNQVTLISEKCVRVKATW